MKEFLICVERSVKGRKEWLPLENQRSYKEWNGCFTMLPAGYFKRGGKP